MLELKGEDFIYGFWFGENKESNYMGILLTRDGKYHLLYRFRYFEDTKIYDSKDRRSAYHAICGEASTPIKELMPKIELIMTTIRIKYPNLKWYKVKGDFDKFRYILCQEDFGHVKLMPSSKSTQAPAEA